MVSDLRKDLQSMEDDREVLVRRIERTQRKVQATLRHVKLTLIFHGVREG